MSRDRLFWRFRATRPFRPSCPVASAAFALRVDLFLLHEVVLDLAHQLLQRVDAVRSDVAPMSTYMMESPTLSTPSFSHVRT